MKNMKRFVQQVFRLSLAAILGVFAPGLSSAIVITNTATFSYTGGVPVNATSNATTVYYAISGRVVDGGNNGEAGVTITVTGGPNSVNDTAATAADGTFTISGIVKGLVDGTYTVTPSLLGRTFTPASKSVPLAGANGTANFTDTTPALPNIACTKTADVANVVSGGKINYTIICSNTGGPATGFTLTDTLPVGTVNPTNISVPGQFDGTKITWSMGALATNGSLTETFTVDVK